jgi:hypothetical protein
MSLLALIPLIGDVLDKVLPDAQAAADAKVKLLEVAQRGELAILDAETRLATGQMEVNKAEAQNASVFVSGWRPFIGWICGLAFGYKFVFGPIAAFILTAYGVPTTVPALEFGEMLPVLLGMLGIGALRTVEKVKGVA